MLWLCISMRTSSLSGIFQARHLFFFFVCFFRQTTNVAMLVFYFPPYRGRCTFSFVKRTPTNPTTSGNELTNKTAVFVWWRCWCNKRADFAFDYSRKRNSQLFWYHCSFFPTVSVTAFQICYFCFDCKRQTSISQTISANYSQFR